jgi:hypothetical protein
MPIKSFKRVLDPNDQYSFKMWWRAHWIFVTFIVFTITTGLALVQAFSAAEDADKAAKAAQAQADTNTQILNELEHERVDRINAGASVVSFLCIENNRQDETLGKLVSVSLPEEGDTFGDSLDPSLFTPFDIRVLETIAKVQIQEAQSQESPTKTFKDELQHLNDTVLCQDLAYEFAKQSGLSKSKVVITPIKGVTKEGKPLTSDRSSSRDNQKEK